MTDGKFDLAKWRARMDTYNTPAIKQAVAAAVADGTIIGNSVMDEPHNETVAAGWGGNVTKAMVDGMCGYVKQIFPTLDGGRGARPPAVRAGEELQHLRLRGLAVPAVQGFRPATSAMAAWPSRGGAASASSSA